MKLKSVQRCLKQLTIAIFIILLFSPQIPISAEENNALNYVSLGDSVAFGIDHQNEPTPIMGYFGLLAAQLKQINLLGDLPNNFAKPGYKTDDVLKDIQDNVPLKEGSNILIQPSIQNADIITISVGANDVLSYVEIDKSTGTVSFKEEEIAEALVGVGQNLGTIIAQIRTMNPEASIYVMGYYNAFPHLPNTEQEKVKAALNQLNAVIHEVAAATHSTYVSTAESFEADPTKFVPNPANIHPNMDGYYAIANDFWSRMFVRGEQEYKDVKENDWAYEAIQYMTTKGVIWGYTDGRYGYHDPVKRSQVVLMLTRNHIYSTPAELIYFKDIPIDDPLMINTAQLVHNNIIKGYPDGTFKPAQSMTRAEMAVMIVDAFNLQGSTEHSFTDVPKGHWASEAITTLAAHNITNGISETKFGPDQPVKRSEFAAFLYRSMTTSN
ncbi:S-layer homology domain-containing protein [Bacillus sp. Marseille-Q3570]|uniref:S-layer homology domain-containing protein n=1 Tax=Bacillus sp. Marseille-Q3570 TaxID=2963522 RepID=UPI0021B77000|nr:S-layer homology domain-containing protein [Bacillus sp. Marseille-Q3570]